MSTRPKNDILDPKSLGFNLIEGYKDFVIHLSIILLGGFLHIFSISTVCQRFLFCSSLWIWIIRAWLSMHICSFQQSAYICTSFIISCLFFCSRFITLLEVIKFTFNVYSIKRINLRIFQTIFYYYFYENNSISNNTVNLYLFKRVTFDVM